MMISIAVTERIRKRLKIDLYEGQVISPNSIYSWHTGYYIYNRKLCLIVANDLTRYCVVLYGLKASDMKNFTLIFKQQLKRNLILDGISSVSINKYMEEADNSIFTKSSDRSVLGSINDYMVGLSYYIEDYIFDEVVNLDALNSKANKNICLPLEKVGLPPYLKEAMRIEMAKL